MNYKIILFILTILILAGCNQDIQNKNSIKFSPEQKYKNTGFTLIYNNSLKKEKKISKRIDNRALIIFHKNLKKDSFVKITNVFSAIPRCSMECTMRPTASSRHRIAAPRLSKTSRCRGISSSGP